MRRVFSVFLDNLDPGEICIYPLANIHLTNVSCNGKTSEIKISSEI